MTNAQLKKRLQRSCLAILLVGLCSAMLIHLFAEDTPDDSLGYVIVNGTVYPLSTRDSKTYRREVQRFGGKAALVFDDFNRWFGDLWQGKKLARTVAWISALLALGIYVFANSLPPDAPPERGGAREPEGPG
ncbi:MAG: hypothetical protein D4R74_09900 [Betaproteobacteria bacterium]|nr:MAG: hypothetical protein D4R74_09900 [Betaproteobacteria bacterium]